MLSQDSVINAYRLILGRDPESAEVIAWHQHHESFRHLGFALLTSPEFRQQLGYACHKEIIAELDKLEGIIEVETDPASLRALLAHIESVWTKLGRDDPHWAVLSDARFKTGRYNEHATEFEASGRSAVEQFGRSLKRNRIDEGSLATCLEYGCGTGRVTRFLAERFDDVIACDISAPMLELAESYLSREHLSGRVKFVLTRSLAALDILPKVNVIFSILVLQHNPPPVMAYILRRLLDALKPGGVAYVQVPTLCPGYTFEVQPYLTSQPSNVIEMHVLPQRYVFAIAEELRCAPLEIRFDNHVGLSNWISNNLCVASKRIAERSF